MCKDDAADGCRDKYAETLNILISFASGVIQLGAAVGSLFMRPLAERLGRKNTLIFISLFSISGGLIAVSSSFLYSVTALILARFVQGFALGVILGILPIYFAEMVPLHKRPFYSSLLLFSTTSTDILSQGFATEVSKEHWSFALAPPLFTAALLLLTFWKLAVDSPKFLLARGRRSEATAATRALLQSEAVATEFLARLEKELEEEKAQATISDWERTKELFKFPHLRRPFLLLLVSAFALMGTGISYTMAFSSEMLRDAGLKDAVNGFVVGIGVWSFLLTFVGVACLQSPIISLKTQFLSFLVVCFFSNVALAIAFAVRVPISVSSPLNWDD